MDHGRHSRDSAIVNGARPAGEGDYDALAELFLGDNPTDHDQSARAGDARTQPAVETANQTSPTAPTSHADDAGDADTAPRRRNDPNSAADAAIEAMILGHLPVLAGAWALAYCGEVAEQRQETIGLLRLTAGRTAIDIFGDERLQMLNGGAPFAALDEALAVAAGAVDRWIIRVDATDEPQVACAEDVNAVTLLCGADEASTVAAYRTIKSLASMLDEVRERRSDARPVCLRAAVMGAESEKAEQAGAKLQRAAEAFLDRPLEIAAPVQRVGASRPAHLHDAEFPGDASALLDRLHAALRAPRAAEPDRPQRAERSAAGGEPCVATTHREDAKSGAWTEPRAPEPVLQGPASAPVRSSDAGLFEHVDGLSGLTARCPFEESVELAVDDQGRLHLLARQDRRSIEALTVVAEWAVEHSALLSMTSGAHRIDPALPPQRHLFTDRPAEARRLLDAPIHVHLLAPVRIGAESGWFCTELN